ncbi:uncharacterized protein LOC109606356 [Aethina tumida]|uniref:uncharacterized protein LOC109606356 n=1 Tax=Aethina tumida TaxID=116153 RepID=UPI00096B5643|nr:uncharacterized protein LOC109606356 [Aethina tumida]
MAHGHKHYQWYYWGSAPHGRVILKVLQSVGQSLRLPGEFIGDVHKGNTENVSDFIKELRQHMRNLRPTSGSRRRFSSSRILHIADQVFLRNNRPKAPLQPTYEGPHKVINRNRQTFILNIRRHPITVNVNRLKPAHTLSENIPDEYLHTDMENDYILVPGRPATPDTTVQPVPSIDNSNRNNGTVQPDAASIRKVRFIDRYQAGLGRGVM